MLRGWVTRIDTDAKRLEMHGQAPVTYDKLLIATGSKSNKFGWPGQDLRGVQGLYSLQDLESMERHTVGCDRAVIVGGGLIGIETAEMLLSRGIGVTMLVREPSWMNFAFPAEESAMINRHILEHGVDLRLGTELSGILPDERKLEYYTSVGVTEAVLRLPSAPRDQVLPILDEYARFLGLRA